MITLDQDRYTEEKVLWIKQHTPKLMSFAITRPEGYTFKAGQFSKLGIIKDGEHIWRAYSVVSPEEADFLEFFAILIEDGLMSQHFKQMQVGDDIALLKDANGYLVPELFVDGKDLIMLSTGSGIAPFISMLYKPAVWEQFEHVTLVHSVSYAHELVYDETIANLAKHPIIGNYMDRFTYQPVVTREEHPGALNKRVTALLESGELEQALNTKFNATDTRFMLCGNPSMVKATFGSLRAIGFKIHRTKMAGQIIMEHAF